MQKKPWTLLAIGLTLVMIAGAMSWGAVKHWSGERDDVIVELSQLANQLQKRVEIAHNILIVAGRHLTDDNAAVVALSEDIKLMEGSGSLEDKAKADLLLSSHARGVLAALEATDAGDESNFDFDYVKKRFPQELEQSQEGVIDIYRSAVKTFNSNLTGSISGAFARAMGISPVMENITVTVSPSLPPIFEKGIAVYIPGGLLSENTTRDIDKLNSLLKETGFHFVVAAQHFIGGSNVKSYADKLFREQGLDEKAIMLFMAIGELRYSFTTGTAAMKVLSDEDINSYLAREFRTPFMEHQYDTAIGSFLLAAGGRIAEQKGVAFSKAGLFGIQEEETTPAAGWWKDFFQGSVSTLQRFDKSQSEDTGRIGFSVPTIVIIGIVLYALFGRKKGARQGKGCGCGPLGWIFGAFGIANLFGFRKH